MATDGNDFNKPEGRIRFTIEKLSEFAQAPDNAERRSDVLFVRGLPWRILTTNRKFEQTKQLGYFLQCDITDPDWSCAADAKLRILSQKGGGKDYMRSITHVYAAKENDWGWDKFLTFEQLMAPESGLYNEQSDTIILEVELKAEAPQGIKNMGQVTNFSNAKPIDTIKVNEEEVHVNKYVLAISSTYFERYFFDQRYEKPENIVLNPSTTVEDFKRMIATLPPEHRKLDDDCFEAVLILADRFSMDNLIDLCRNFLVRESAKPKLFKLRMAHKYGWNGLKEAILQSLQPEDFNFFEQFGENATELALLDGDVKEALLARHAELVSGARK